MTSNRSPQAKPPVPHPEPRSLARDPPPDAPGFLVVGIGASAGGLEACINLVGALRETGGMAFILVQHLDPGFPSMMADLLSEHTAMPVLQATDGLIIEPDHFYIIPPGSYLVAHGGMLHLSAPQPRHGVRLPFDFLLHSLATAYGPDAVGIVLSGTGADGSLGLAALKASGGFVIAQDPNEAGHDGMPNSAIHAGVVDLVLPVAEIPAALDVHARRAGASGQAAIADAPPPTPDDDCLPEIIELLRTQTPHDFRLYKHGTLLRRIGRRMATAPIEPGNMRQYLALLRTDQAELDLLAKNLLINVTSFFRDQKVFDLLDATIVPEMIRNLGAGEALRVWVAGCSTGEETYSLAMLLLDHLGAVKSPVKLQIFASDVDPAAIATARDGHYPFAIEADVPAARLARFFTKDDNGYRVTPDLRGMVVFTVQDVLADPPFSRLDLVSCRNLLIYLSPQAQAKVISLFHFALRPGGLLLLGGAETVGNAAGRFEAVAKVERLYRQVGRSRPADFEFSMSTGDGARARIRPGLGQPPTRQTTLAELGRRLVLESYAPAAVLINAKHEALYMMGPTDRYLRLAPGLATHDLLAMTRDSMRTKLRAAIQQAGQQKVRVMVPGGRTPKDRGDFPFTIDVHPLLREDEELYLVCFVDEPRHTAPAGQATRAIAARDMPRVAELEHELSDTRAELQGAIRSLELASEEQKSINEEALSVNEEYQSTNEELLTSKEELQSLNEELTALNSQLQETLDRQRRTSDDLQNVLYSTDVATLFLDVALNIRFFTPATRALFNILPTDVGRPLSDLSSLAADRTLPADARTVLDTALLQEREIETRTGVWFNRRILPYRTHDGSVEGVVITFTDVSERKLISKALQEAKHEAEAATAAKSRFLAAASHDLRQPLQTVALIQGLLAKTVEGERAQDLVGRLDESLDAMTGMLDTLLDINQIEAGVVVAEKQAFPVNDLLNRLGGEFGHLAQVQGLGFRTVPCSLSIDSDPRLLEQMLRNLLSNALKYTRRGKVLFGCRRHGGILTIEIGDTGVGIPPGQLTAVFDEYHQLDNAARERSRGLGLGLSIVQRLADLLGHRVHVRSIQGRGSIFGIDVAVTPGRPAAAAGMAATVRATAETRQSAATGPAAPAKPRRTAGILVVEDDPELRALLEQFLTGEGYRVAMAVDGPAALHLVRGTVRPDLLLADYNLPGGMTGLQLATRLRIDVDTDIPVIVLTGDISTETLRDVAAQRCLKLNKPVRLAELHEAIQSLLPQPQPPGHPSGLAPGADGKAPRTVFIVDDDDHVRDALQAVLAEDGIVTHAFATGEAFLAAYRPGGESCLLLDAGLPGMSGIAVLQRMHALGFRPPTIMITGNGDTTVAIAAMKAGAFDFIQKPIGREDLLASMEHAFEMSRDSRKLVAWRKEAAAHVADLTPRQFEVMTLVLAGHPSKIIAADLGISQRTVENHRAAIMEKTGASSVAALARMALAAVSDPDA